MVREELASFRRVQSKIWSCCRLCPAARGRAAATKISPSGHPRRSSRLLAISPLAESDWLDDMGRKVPLVQLGVHLASEEFDTIVGDDAQYACKNST